jgi:hypothetical protein
MERGLLWGSFDRFAPNCEAEDIVGVLAHVGVAKLCIPKLSQGLAIGGLAREDYARVGSDGAVIGHPWFIFWFLRWEVRVGYDFDVATAFFLRCPIDARLGAMPRWCLSVGCQEEDNSRTVPLPST